MKEALFQHQTGSGKIRCGLCPHQCAIGEGKHGVCRIRRVANGRLIASGYGLVSSFHLDPIEKKPLYHFMPGSMISSVGGWGCNLSCRFCQNWTISQNVDENARLYEPEQIVQAALNERSAGIAYTYNEPVINIEFVHDCARKAAEQGLVNVLVTNGFVEREAAEYLLDVVDALNIDVKSMDDSFYRKRCGGFLDPVLSFAVQAVSAGRHVEITNLLIPGLNDSEEQLGKLSGWIGANLGRRTPLHLSAYRPEFKMNRPPTSTLSLERAFELCSRDLDYVYIGNMPARFGRDTSCPGCGNVLISRQGYSASVEGLAGSTCSSCGRKADIVLERRISDCPGTKKGEDKT